MRTTINLEDDVFRVVRDIARAEARPLGRVISDLVRNALAPSALRIDEEDGFPVFKVDPGAAPITSSMVSKALDEDQR